MFFKRKSEYEKNIAKVKRLDGLLAECDNCSKKHILSLTNSNIKIRDSEIMFIFSCPFCGKKIFYSVNFKDRMEAAKLELGIIYIKYNNYKIFEDDICKDKVLKSHYFILNDFEKEFSLAEKTANEIFCETNYEVTLLENFICEPTSLGFTYDIGLAIRIENKNVNKITQLFFPFQFFMNGNTVDNELSLRKTELMKKGW